MFIFIFTKNNSFSYSTKINYIQKIRTFLQINENPIQILKKKTRKKIEIEIA